MVKITTKKIDACVTYCQGIFPPSSTISFRLASRTSGILVRDKKWQPFSTTHYLFDSHSSTKPTNVKLLNVKSMLSAHRTKSPLNPHPPTRVILNSNCQQLPSNFSENKFHDHSWLFMEIPDHNKVRLADTIRLCFSQECPVIYRNLSGICI